MNITDLQSLLHEQAEGVTDQGAPSRGNQIEHRIGVVRRRRAAGVVAGLVLAIAGTGAAATLLPGRDSADPGPSTDPDAPTFRSTIAGMSLLDSIVSAKGAAIASLRTEVPTNHLQLSYHCFADGPRSWFHLTVNGELLTEGHCNADATIKELGGGGISSRVGEQSVFNGLTAAGGHLDIEMWTTLGDDGPRITDPTTVLAAGIYRLPPVVEVIAGYEVFGLTEFEGQTTWTFDGASSEHAGLTRWTDSTDASQADTDLLAMVYVPRFEGKARILVNGKAQVTLGGGGSTKVLVPRTDGERSVEIRLSGEAPAEGMGIAWYRPID